MKILNSIPQPPRGKDKRVDEYERNLEQVKRAAWENVWYLEFYILKACTDAKDFYFMLNEVPVKELSLFIKKAYLK